MKISKIIFILFFFLGFNSQGSVNLNIEEVTTSRGFKFLFVKNCDLPKVALNVSFKNAGYAYESDEKQGLTWLTSLLIYEGAGNNDAEAFAEKLEDKGINLEFTSGLDSFKISLNTLSENIEDAISLMSDAIIHPVIDRTGMNRVFEKVKVVLNNLEKDPYFIAEKEINGLLFKKHPYSRSGYGTHDTIMGITRDDVLKYIGNNFAKDNIVISVVGCVTKEKIGALLDKYLSKLPLKRSKVKKIPLKNEFLPAESRKIFMDIPQSVVFFAQRGLVYKDPDYYNASVLINALGGIGLNSLLMEGLRKNLGVTYYISFIPISRKHGSTLVGVMSTDNSTVVKAVSAVREILSLVRKNGIDERQFRDTKVSLINNFIFSLSNNMSIAILLDEIQANDRDINCINDFSHIINGVRLKEVNQLASSLLDPENLFFVEVGRSS